MNLKYIDLKINNILLQNKKDSQLREKIQGYVNDLNDNILFQLYRKYIEINDYYDDQVYELDKDVINNIFHNTKYSKLLQLYHFGQFNIYHNYFRFDGYGNLQSFNSLDDYKTDIINDIIDNIDEYANEFSDIDELHEQWKSQNEEQQQEDN